MGGDFGLLANRMAQGHAVNRVGIECYGCRIYRYELALRSRRSAVKRASHAAGATIEHVGVDHGRADVFVTEQFLDCADIVAVFQQMGGK